MASTLGAVGGALVNYGLNHRFTFASGRSHATALPRFAAIAAVGIAVNGAVMALLLGPFGAHYVVAQVVATGAVLVVGFLANRTWTF
jgi:putative flippase GtrA